MQMRAIHKKENMASASLSLSLGSTETAAVHLINSLSGMFCTLHAAIQNSSVPPTCSVILV